MENKKKEYTGMKAVVIEFNKNDIIATSDAGKCVQGNVGMNPFIDRCEATAKTINL